jgi:ribosomal protein S18 acetylase RimI-like enzyme
MIQVDKMLKIRTYCEDDDERIIEITKVAWPGATMCKTLEDMFGVRGRKPWWRHKVDPILAFAKAHPNEFLVAEYGGIICGYAMYILDHDRKIGTVSNNAVDPAYGRKGIGSAMNRQVLMNFKKAGMEIAYVATLEHQTAARKMYEKHGFKEVARRIEYVQSVADLKF